MVNRLKNYASWFNWIVKSPANKETTSFSLEHISFNAILFAASLISIFSCIFNFIGSFDVLLNVFTIFSSLVLVFLYYLSRFRNYYNIWISTITILLLLSLSWLMNAGSIGSGSYLYLLSLVLLIIIARRHQQNWIFSLVLLNISVLYILEYYFGNRLVHPYPDLSSYYGDMIFVFILVLFCVFFATRFIKRSFDDERNIVNQQRLIIEEQNNELLASLTYASNLQKKIISNENQLGLLFSDYFVLFKPKDIVSGDYYWIKERGKYSIVVVADCTGHGVPAAFLSIMGISLFEEIIKQEGEELNAGALLGKLRDKFIAYLEKNNLGEEYSRDGMDVGICVVNYEDYTFQFSGANRSLVMVRSNKYSEAPGYYEKEKADAYTLYSYKPTKNTIGFNYKEYPFTTHTINFFLKDTFYLFSDGYGDQFDSQNKKKFKVSKLKKEFLKVQDLPLPTQGEYLNSLHKKWKGDMGQTDDILIIGLRM